MKLLRVIYDWIMWVRDTMVFGQWQKFWDYVKLVHSASDDASSKRFYGGIGYMASVVLLYLFSANLFPIDKWNIIAPYWTFLILLSTGLISISMIEKLAAIIANFKIKALTKE